MHCSFFCRTIFHQTAFQDTFQSKIQNLSVVRDTLWDTRNICTCRHRSADLQSRKQRGCCWQSCQGDGHAASDQMWLSSRREASTPCHGTDTQRSSLRKAEFSKGLIRTQGRMRQAQSSKVRLTIAKVFFVLFFYPHLCSPVAFRPSGWVHVWWVPAEAVSQFHKAPEDNSVLYQLQSNLHIQKYRGF